MRIVYRGVKEQKGDNVAGTGLVWTRGQIHEVEDEEKAAKLLAHPLIWADASQKYELVPEPVVVKPEPRVSFTPADAKDAFWDPIVIPIPAEVFARLQKKELVSTFMTPDDADAFAAWKLTQAKAVEAAADTAPKKTGPTPDLSKMDKRSREYKDAIAHQGLGGKGLEPKKVA